MGGSKLPLENLCGNCRTAAKNRKASRAVQTFTIPHFM
jgi:hypothetical protein